MSDKIKTEYHGYDIHFDEKNEGWFIIIDGKIQYHKSLQSIKNYIDRLNKKDFKRIPVYVFNGGYFRGGREGYAKAEITSIGVDRTVYVVREGNKNAEHCGTAFVRNAKNEELIKRIEEAKEEKDRADRKYEEAKTALERLDLEKVIDKALRS